LWRLHGLEVQIKRLRRQIATGAGDLWAYDFVHDACANGQ